MGTLYTIPSRYGFAAALARGLLDQHTPEDLAQVHLYLPTRRGVRTVQEALAAAAGGRPLLLPRLFTLGDVEADDLALMGGEEVSASAGELPPPLAATHQLFLLARLVDHAWDRVLGGTQPKSQTQVFAYARALKALLDTVETEGVSLEALSTAAPTDAALEGFWERAGRFIALIQDQWPNLEAETGRLSMARRRRKLLELLGQEWAARPPDHPLILAGTTATIPAVGDLACLIGGLPQGQIVLPGLDGHLDAATWTQVAVSPSHPQFGLKRLLDRLGCEPHDVAIWPACDGALDQDRHAALSAAQRPATAAAIAAVPAPFDLSGLALVEAPSNEVEARTLAVFLRAALEAPEAQAALVTPDRDLAARVAAELRRWGIEVDDSAGVSLAASSLGRLVQASAALIGPIWSALALARVLAHPLVTLGLDFADARAFARQMDLALRGVGQMAGATLAWPDSPASARLKAAWASCADGEVPARLPPPDWVARHLRLLDTLNPDAAALWQGPAAQAIAAVLEEVQTYGAVSPAITAHDYADLIAQVLGEVTRRPTYGAHARVRILGTLEARLLHVDALALGGLNEGTWPKETDVGPWMNRPTRALVGLPSPERKVGLAAHDLAQAFASPRLLLTRTARVDGTPTLASRWIERLNTLLVQTGQDTALAAAGAPYLRAALALDLPASSASSTPSTRAPRALDTPAQACPPLAARPKTLHATDVGLLVTNPYGFYAKRILKLRALDPRGSRPPDQAWGNLVHDILERATDAPNLGLDRLWDLGRDYLEREEVEPGTAALWHVQLRHTLAQFWRLYQPYANHPGVSESVGSLDLNDHRLTGRADRVVAMPGHLLVLDYKTGQTASDAKQRRGIDPQLSILGLIAEASGFADAPTLKGRDQVLQAFLALPKRAHDQGKLSVTDADVRTEVRAGLETLLTAYQDPDQPYLVAPFGDSVGRANLQFDDYAHLARRSAL